MHVIAICHRTKKPSKAFMRNNIPLTFGNITFRLKIVAEILIVVNRKMEMSAYRKGKGFHFSSLVNIER